jgi:hypothetical protein
MVLEDGRGGSEAIFSISGDTGSPWERTRCVVTCKASPRLAWSPRSTGRSHGPRQCKGHFNVPIGRGQERVPFPYVAICHIPTFKTALCQDFKLSFLVILWIASLLKTAYYER